MRTFVAIDLEREIKNNISKFLERLDTGLRNVRWIKFQGMHITLKFLGEVGEEKLHEIKEALRSTAAEFRPFSLQIKGTGTFPHAKRNPRILWLGVECDPILINLQEKMELKLENIGFPREKRKYHPHLTLGRVKAPFKLQPILDELGKNKDVLFGEMSVTKTTLFQSILKPTGAEYKIISEISLG
jgi:2'-5' RNA ligase